MLITLVIIGIVAALTIPNLLQKYQEQATVKKVQKFYSTLSNAYSLAMKEYGVIDEWGLTGWNIESNEKIYHILFKPYFKIAKNCGANNTENCISNTDYKFLNNTNAGSYGSRDIYYKITLDDDASIWWRAATTYALVFFDVNGPKGPNQWGKDLFYFNLSVKQAKAIGAPNSNYNPILSDGSCNKSGEGRTCAGWVVYKGNMDYLHCDDLSWTGKDRCK